MRTWSRSSRRSVPTKRSAKAFAFGAWIGVRTTRLPTTQRARANPLGAPAWVARRDLSDERRARGGRSTHWSRASPPQHAETLPVPAEDRSRLDEQDGRAPRRREARGEAHREALPWCPLDPAHDLPLRDDQLLSEQGVLGDQPGARSDEIGDHPTHEPN